MFWKPQPQNLLSVPTESLLEPPQPVHIYIPEPLLQPPQPHLYPKRQHLLLQMKAAAGLLASHPGSLTGVSFTLPAPVPPYLGPRCAWQPPGSVEIVSQEEPLSGGGGPGLSLLVSDSSFLGNGRGGASWDWRGLCIILIFVPRVKKPPSVTPIFLEPPPKEEAAPGAAEQT